MLQLFVSDRECDVASRRCLIGLYNVLCLSIGTQKKIDYLRRSLWDWGWEEGNYKDFYHVAKT